MKNYQLTIRSKAWNDIIDQAVYIAQNNSDAAFAFRTAVESTCILLCKQPHIGVLYRSNNAALNDIRMFPVNGFSNSLLFYHIDQETVEIVRVLSAARDIGSIL